MYFQKDKIKQAIFQLIAGIGLSLVLAFVLVLIFQDFSWEMIIRATKIMFLWFGGICVAAAFLTLFYEDEYVFKHSVIIMYYGGLALHFFIKSVLPNEEKWVHILLSVGLVLLFNDLYVASLKKEKKNKLEKEELWEKAYSQGLKDGYKKGFEEKQFDMINKENILKD
ncbi:MAG: hypothetical protein IJM98_09005 [Oscillospiraceae bacterium]|nr:hypothetical protein [Oscillospiraceae bacterium]